MKCKECGRTVSRYMRGECLACRYKKMKCKTGTDGCGNGENGYILVREKPRANKVKARLKCDPAKLPYRGEPTRQYKGPDPEHVAYAELLKEATKYNFKPRKQDGLAR